MWRRRGVRVAGGDDAGTRPPGGRESPRAPGRHPYTRPPDVAPDPTARHGSPTPLPAARCQGGAGKLTGPPPPTHPIPQGPFYQPRSAWPPQRPTRRQNGNSDLLAGGARWTIEHVRAPLNPTITQMLAELLGVADAELNVWRGGGGEIDGETPESAHTRTAVPLATSHRALKNPGSTTR